MEYGLTGGQYRPLTQDQVGRIHQSALGILEETGVRVELPEAAKVFQNAGAAWSGADHRVRIPARLVERSLGSAPSAVCLCGRDPRYDLRLEGAEVHMGTGGAAVRVVDPDTDELRPGTLADVANLARLVDGLDNVHFFIRPCTAQDVPAEKLAVNEFYAALANTGKHVMGAGYTLEGTRDVLEMAACVAGGEEEALRERPFVSFIAGWMISPLTYEPETTRVLMELARRGIPVALSSAPMAGSTAPITMAGTLVQLHAEELSGLVLTQLVRPGAPVLYGGIPGMADMHDLSYRAGGVEFGLMNAAISQLAAYLGIPNYCSAGITEAKIPSMQAIYEKTFSICQVALAGWNYIHHAAGVLDSIMTVDYGQFVIDNEIIGMAMKMLRGIHVDEEHLAVDEIRTVGPGGNFLALEHTIRHLRDEYLEPMLASRQQRAGMAPVPDDRHRDVLAGARQRAREIIDQAQPPEIPPKIDRRIRNRFQLLGGEPPAA
jgi:trimethylamine--corrinoid protein Co-methyltransferase